MPVLTIVRKVNADTSEAFNYAVTGAASHKGFDVDPSETYAYVALAKNPTIVVQMSASSGSAVGTRSQ